MICRGRAVDRRRSIGAELRFEFDEILREVALDPVHGGVVLFLRAAKVGVGDGEVGACGYLGQAEILVTVLFGREDPMRVGHADDDIGLLEAILALGLEAGTESVQLLVLKALVAQRDHRLWKHAAAPVDHRSGRHLHFAFGNAVVVHHTTENELAVRTSAYVAGTHKQYLHFTTILRHLTTYFDILLQLVHTSR